MLKVTRLSAKFEILPLFKGKITISSVQLFGFNINLNKKTPDSPPNFKFVLDAFASKDTVKKEKNIDLRINSILIRRGKLAYDVLSEEKTPGKDVYKRQAVSSSVATSSTVSCPSVATEVFPTAETSCSFSSIEDFSSSTISSALSTSPMLSSVFTPVSYTHLDVYKRQALAASTAPPS